jgi:hypothetical protein
MSFLCCCYPAATTATKSNNIKLDELGSFAMNSIEDDVLINTSTVTILPSECISEYNNERDYEDLEHIARSRQVRVTIRRGTQAGVAAGLSVMAGVIIAGPPGAVVGAAVGGAVAHRISQNVVSLNELLKATPISKRNEILRVFRDSFKEEFVDTIQKNPELRLLMGGTSIFGVMRYMVDRELLRNDQLVRLDAVLRKVV